MDWIDKVTLLAHRRCSGHRSKYFESLPNETLRTPFGNVCLLGVTANWRTSLFRRVTSQPGLENSQHEFEIRDVLAKRDTSNANAQRELAVSYDDLGKVLELQGNESGALEKYKVSHSISPTGHPRSKQR